MCLLKLDAAFVWHKSINDRTYQMDHWDFLQALTVKNSGWEEAFLDVYHPQDQNHSGVNLEMHQNYLENQQEEDEIDLMEETLTKYMDHRIDVDREMLWTGKNI